MKKVLIIANLYHASPRIPDLATYLHEFGWQASIVTPPISRDSNFFGFPKGFLDRVKIIEAPYKGDIFWFWRKIFRLLSFRTDESVTEQIKQSLGITRQRSFIDAIMKWYQTIFAYPDAEKTWKKSAVKTASEVIVKEQFDALLSSSPSPTSHIVAYELKKRFKLPWVADFRDLWTLNHNYPYNKIRKYFEERLERRIIACAATICAVTPSLAQKQQLLHKKHVHVITNGYDPENLNVLVPLTKKFNITYTGTIYTNKQDPEKIFKALSSLIYNSKINQDDIELRLYGPPLQWLKNKIKENNLTDSVKIYGIIPRAESFLRQKESQVLLILNWEDVSQKGVYTTKLFEYLSAQRPILATGGSRGDEIERILSETKAGVYATTLEEIETALLNFYYEYKQTGRVSYSGNLNKINKYSFREIAGKLAVVLDQIAKNKYE